MEAALSHRMRGVGSPETEHKKVAVDPTKSCCIIGIAITEGATGGGSSGRKGEKKSTHKVCCQTTTTVSLQFAYLRTWYLHSLHV